MNPTKEEIEEALAIADNHDVTGWEMSDYRAISILAVAYREAIKENEELKEKLLWTGVSAI